jgi:hypothetical protein
VGGLVSGASWGASVLTSVDTIEFNQLLSMFLRHWW